MAGREQLARLQQAADRPPRALMSRAAPPPPPPASAAVPPAATLSVSAEIAQLRAWYNKNIAGGIHSTRDWGAMFWAPLKMFVLMQAEELTLAQRKLVTHILQQLIPSFLPCPRCARHFAAAASQVYPHTATRWALWRWIVDVHNSASRRSHPHPQQLDAVAALRRFRPAALCESLRRAWTDVPEPGAVDPNSVIDAPPSGSAADPPVQYALPSKATSAMMWIGSIAGLVLLAAMLIVAVKITWGMKDGFSQPSPAGRSAPAAVGRSRR